MLLIVLSIALDLSSQLALFEVSHQFVKIHLISCLPSHEVADLDNGFTTARVLSILIQK